jgi:hypothetical protein
MQLMQRSHASPNTIAENHQLHGHVCWLSEAELHCIRVCDYALVMDAVSVMVCEPCKTYTINW